MWTRLIRPSGSPSRRVACRTTWPQCFGSCRTRCSTSELIFRLRYDVPTSTDPLPELRIIQDYIDRLEAWCDRFGDPLPNLKSFILPGGSPAAAQLHVARTVVRRAERAAWAAAAAYGTEAVADPELPGGVNTLAITYLNRLSDLLFIFTRVVNGTDADVLWVPGGERSHLSATES